MTIILLKSRGEYLKEGVARLVAEFQIRQLMERDQKRGGKSQVREYDVGVLTHHYY